MVQNYKMAKNIEFKGLLNTVPYFLCGEMCGDCGKIYGWIVGKMIIGQIWIIKYEK